MKYAILIGVIFCAVFTHHFPTYYALLKTPSNTSFSGQAAWFDPWDTNVYVSAIKEGQNGNLLYSNQFTTIKHKPLFVYTFYTLTGLLFNNVDPYSLFQIESLIFSALLVVGTFLLSGSFIKSIKVRQYATILIVLGGGIGWMIYPYLSLPDMTIPAFIFHEGFHRPHIAFDLLFYISSLIVFYKAISLNKNFFYIASCLLITPSLIIHPFMIVIYGLIILSYALFIYKKYSTSSGLIYSVFILVFLFFFELLLVKHLLSSTGFGSLMSEQIVSPNIIFIILGFGLIGAFASLSIRYFYKKDEITFLIIWVVSSLLAAMIPVGFRVFFLRGIFLPVTILSIYGLGYAAKRLKLHLKIPIIAIYIIVLFISLGSTFRIFYIRTSEAGKTNQWFYVPDETLQAINYFSTSRKNVLSAMYFGNLLPVFTDSKSFYGHPQVTSNADEKLFFLHLFYANKLQNSEIKQYLTKNNIEYIVYGPEEVEISKLYDNIDGIKYPELKSVYKNKTVEIYKVQ